MTTHIGLETRVAADGSEQAWRLAVFNDRMPSTVKTWKGSIPVMTYIREPRDPIHGNLTDLGPTLVDQADTIAEHLSGVSRHGVDVVEHHGQMPVIEALRERGVKIVEVDTPTPAAGALVDPYAIGGFAGHDIATLVAMSETAS